MLDKFITVVRQQGRIKFYIIGLVLAAILAVSGYSSLFLWVAVAVGFIPALLSTPLFKNKLSYDLKESLLFYFSLLSSVSWALYMSQSIQSYPQIYSLVYVVLVASALILLNTLKQNLAVIIPLLTSFVYLLVFTLTPAATMVAILSTVFTLLLIAQTLFTSSVGFTKKGSAPESSESTKMELVSEVDSLKIKNKKFRARLKQIEVELSAAEMAKMEFLATMSHEIRTPLNGIIPLLDILLDSELSDFQRDYLSTAHISAIQMQKLIDDLLDYSKVEAGKLSVETRGLKVPRILAAVKASYKGAAQKKNISIQVETHKNVSPLLRGDPTRLRQVLSNLVSNAIKFSSSGTITITAEKLKDSPTKEVIRFAVTDQGIGLDKETRDNIFLPFTQEDGSSTRKFGGTGLGLAISKKIIELMHGTIGVTSEKNKGSTFYFDLPLLKSVGETEVGASGSSEFKAILINTNPLLFNKISKQLKNKEVSTQKALGLSQAYEIYAAINNNSKDNKHILIFVDFETAGKHARSLCQDLSKDETMNNIYACIFTENKNIAGIPKIPNIKLLSKDDSVDELINRIEVMGATARANNESLEAHQDNHPIEPQQAREVEGLMPEILLVEDNEINLKVAEKLIQYIGYPFDFAVNGQEALEKVKQNRYRMILMDCQMPVMDGYRCTTKIRDYETAAGLNRTPILAMTANAMIGDREKCLDAGMDDYMSKPLNRYMLEKTLKKWDPLALSPALNPKTVGKIKAVQSRKNTLKEAPIKEPKEPIEEINKEPTKEGNKEPVEKKKTSITEIVSTEVNQKWLSVKVLEEVKEIMGDETTQLLEMFKQETPGILAKIRSGLKTQNLDEIKKMTHMLKSTSANIGANGLSFFSRKLELAATEKKPISELVTLYTKLNKAYLLTKKEINNYILTSKLVP